MASQEESKHKYLKCLSELQRTDRRTDKEICRGHYAPTNTSFTLLDGERRLNLARQLIWRALPNKLNQIGINSISTWSMPKPHQKLMEDRHTYTENYVHIFYNTEENIEYTNPECMNYII